MLGGDCGEHAQQLEKFDRIIGTLESELGDSFDDTIIVSLTNWSNFGTEWWVWNGTRLWDSNSYGGWTFTKSQIIGDWPG